MKNELPAERGSVTVEYAFALAVLVSVFMIAGIVLTASSAHRAAVSMNSVNSTVPCDGELHGVACL